MNQRFLIPNDLLSLCALCMPEVPGVPREGICPKCLNRICPADSGMKIETAVPLAR